MVKYLATHSDEDNWKVLKDLDILSIRDLILQTEVLHLYPTFDNIMEINKVEKEHRQALSLLDEDDRYILESMIHKALFQAYNDETRYYTHWLFIKQRAEDAGVLDELTPVLDAVKSGQFLLIQLANHGETDELLNDIQLWFASYEKESAAFLSAIDHLTKAWLELFEDGLIQKRQLLEAQLEHLLSNTFGEWMATLRRDRGLSVAKAKLKVGLSEKSIRDIESGRHGIPSIQAMQRLAIGYDVSVGTIASMALERTKSIDEFIQEGFYTHHGEWVDPKKRNVLTKIIRAIDADDIVSAHQNVDVLANL